jgi:hypothetical protein
MTLSTPHTRENPAAIQAYRHPSTKPFVRTCKANMILVILLKEMESKVLWQ